MKHTKSGINSRQNLSFNDWGYMQNIVSNKNMLLVNPIDKLALAYTPAMAFIEFWRLPSNENFLSGLGENSDLMKKIELTEAYCKLIDDLKSLVENKCSNCSFEMPNKWQCNLCESIKNQEVIL